MTLTLTHTYIHGVNHSYLSEITFNINVVSLFTQTIITIKYVYFINVTFTLIIRFLYCIAHF